MIVKAIILTCGMNIIEPAVVKDVVQAQAKRVSLNWSARNRHPFELIVQKRVFGYTYWTNFMIGVYNTFKSKGSCKYMDLKNR
ncbi:hypothetical protein M8C21_023478, partial [Ambrosia artemisiifolia]